MFGEAPILKEGAEVCSFCRFPLNNCQCKGTVMYYLDEYQKQARGTAMYMEGIKTFNEEQLRKLLAVSYCFLGLAGESGESAEKVKKFIRGGTSEDVVESAITWAAFVAKIEKELGDALWYIANAAAELGLSLDDVARANLEKLQDRKARGVLHGSGDNR